jgi:hypothetical protein
LGEAAAPGVLEVLQLAETTLGTVGVADHCGDPSRER